MTKNKWVNITPEQASGRKMAASQIYFKYLSFTASQHKEVNRLYKVDEAKNQPFRALNDEEQLAAASAMASYGLDLDARECPKNRWSIKWTSSIGGGEHIRRVLYQWLVYYIP